MNMIITCPCGEKKFEIDGSLIPEKGRNLQCGSCNREWFFKPNILLLDEEKEETNDLKKELKIDIKSNVDNDNKKPFLKQANSKNKTTKKKVSLLSILLVALLSFIALIIILDTFKSVLILYIPNIETILNNLYETLKDISLFIKDLINN